VHQTSVKRVKVQFNKIYILFDEGKQISSDVIGFRNLTLNDRYVTSIKVCFMRELIQIKS
jgi:hypothetical protein